MSKKYYTFKEIKNNDNLIFDLMTDIIFKNIFLRKECRPYLNLLINSIFNLKYEDLNKKLILKNNELYSDNVLDKSCYADIIVTYKNIDVIIEMNKFKTKTILEKNNNYLFKLQSRKSNNKNKYGKYLFTYLLNFDNYDVLKKNNIKYKSTLNFPAYNICLYKNIKIIHINLAYLRKKYYNGIELDDFEKKLIIFVCQRKDKIREIIKNDAIEGVIKVMDKLKMELRGDIVTYDREAFEKMQREELELDRKKWKKEKNKIEQDKNKIEQDKNKIEQDKNILEKEKVRLSKKEQNLELREENLMNNIISKLKNSGIPEHYLNNIID